jgi:cell division protein FtsB
MFRGEISRKARRDRARRVAPRDAVTYETLEERVVLSRVGVLEFGGLEIGGGLSASLSSVGVVTSPVIAQSQSGDSDSDGSSSQNPNVTQLQKDIQALQTELQTLSGTSGVTIANVTGLASDTQAISQGGVWLDPQALQKVTSELATAVAGGTDTTQPKTDFNALFSGSSVAQTVIDKAFADMVQTIKDSKVTTTDLQTVATDQKAIQTDLTNLTGGNSDRGEGFGFGFIAGFHEGFGGQFGQGVGGLSASLNEIGVVTHPVISAAVPEGPGLGWWLSQNPNFTQLQTDQKALQTELQTLAAKSAVTVADLTNLATDNQTIVGAGLHLDPQSLKTVTTELATAVAGGTDTNQAKTDFNALFKGSSVPQTAIDKTFTDIVQTITDSKVTATDLQTVATDQKAIQTDLTNLFGSLHNGEDNDGDSDDSGTGTGTGSSTGTGTSPGTTRSGSSTTPGGMTLTPIPLPSTIVNTPPSLPTIPVGPQPTATTVSPATTPKANSSHGSSHAVTHHAVTHHAVSHHAVVHKAAKTHGKHG